MDKNEFEWKIKRHLDFLEERGYLALAGNLASQSTNLEHQLRANYGSIMEEVPSF